jgi:putative tricarboxylic transport membrane protein
LGFFLGIIPGGGAVIASFVSYAVEKKVSKNPEKFGKGAIEGVAGPEAANNSATGGAFIPLLTLGIPPNAIMALLLGAFMVHGVQPGPLFIKDHPVLFWSVVDSMYIGNVMLLVLNLPLIGLWVQLLKVPHRILFPLILLFCVIGSYSVNNSLFDVQMMLIFAVIGYLGRKFQYEPAPMILGYILFPLLEAGFRQSFVLSNGSFVIFFTRPIATAGLVIAALVMFTGLIPSVKKRRESLSE